MDEVVVTEEEVIANPPKVLVVESFEERILAPYEALAEGSAEPTESNGEGNPCFVKTFPSFIAKLLSQDMQ